MADPTNPDELGPDSVEREPASQPYGSESLPMEEEEAPRRAASARFIVDAPVGAEAAIRDAMDPANQSLADALRLSFRVLQLVMVVLIVLFLVSGFKTVQDGQSAVRTVWGRIVTTDGEAALKPGAHFSVYPYPIGEFVVIEQENRTVDVGEAFTPPKTRQTREEMIEQADINTPLFPARVGSLITGDGDLAHMEISAKFLVENPVQFVETVNDADRSANAEKIVKLALQRAAVHVAARSALQDLIDLDRNEDAKHQLTVSAQQVLDKLNSGIQIRPGDLQARGDAPFAIQKSLGDLAAARTAAEQAVENARQSANATLINAAGAEYKSLLKIIEQHENALEQNKSELAIEALASINEQIDRASGEVASIVGAARLYQSQIKSTLGSEYARFASLLPTFRQNPALLIRQQWLSTYAKAVKQADTEVLYVPSLLASVQLDFSGSAAVQELRRANQLKQREQEKFMKEYDPNRPYGLLRGEDMTYDRPGRQLKGGVGSLAPSGGRP